jgi:ubiquitin-conjugating enzyme E2 G1
MTANFRITKEYEKLTKDPIENVILEMDNSDIFKWSFCIFGPKDSSYSGGAYKGILSIPKEYPHKPPQVKFTTKLFHPNVYTDGKLCISILHEGIDTTGYENKLERWSPLNNIRTIFISIISLLYDPNAESAANIDAAKLWRENKDAYNKRIKDDMK